jgi:c-di-GMP-binding flagellar brake protein YcgR
VELTQQSLFKKVQRREFFRLACNLPIEYRIIGDAERKLIEEGTPYQEESMNPEWKKGVILDLSGGGIRFVSNEKGQKDAFLQVRFEMPVGDEDEIFCLYATLLRSEQNRNNTSLYDQRIMFWRLDYTLREKVVRSIFEIQRKKRSKATGND